MGDMRVHSKAKRAKTPARNSAASLMFNPVFNNLDVGILILDSKGYYIDVNDTYCRMIGYDRKELIGNHFLTIVPELQKEFVQRSFNEDIVTGAGRKVTEFAVQRKDGHVF